MIKPTWIGLDWGTTNLRAYAVGTDGSVIEERNSDRGMAALKPDEFETALIELIDPWLEENTVMPVYACGMVGARQGWKEAEYKSVPCQPVSGVGLTSVQTSDPRIDVQILPGLSQSSPADVMRGEETQIAGLLAADPSFDGAVCLPGTHSKWVTIEKGEITAFQTFMTGELFSLIASHSVLRHSVSEEGEDHDAFMDAAIKASSDPDSTIMNMFSVRASSLLEEVSPQTSRARLSGMIIGQEIGIARRFWEGKTVSLIGATNLAHLYAELLEKLGAEVTVVVAKEATLSGLSLAAASDPKIAA